MVNLEKYNSFWIALRTIPHKEKAVIRELELRDYEVVFPMFPKLLPSGKKTFRALISSYVFVKTDFKRLENLRYIPGSKGYLQIDCKPALVKDTEIEIMLKICGTLEIENNVKNFCCGDKIKILSGALAGYDGFIISKDRKNICINIGEGALRIVFKTDETVFELIK
ncbi:MAG: transcription termination/antitermination NusG family protein [Bacteroidales bacterium]|nr:transcription termination/antitermination NusG family protein [Bacteroidales bacterium]